MAMYSRGSVVLVAAVCLGGILCPLTSSAPMLSTHTPLAQGDEIAAQTADRQIAVDNDLCFEAGRTVLEDQNNNAVDAAVAILLCLGVVNFHSSGIGGGMVMVVAKKNPDGGEPDVTVIDARVVALGSVTNQNGLAWTKERAKYGLSSITVPGELKGMQMALNLFSEDTLEKRMVLFKDAIHYAKEGFIPSNHLLSAVKCVLKGNPTNIRSHSFKANARLKSGWFRHLNQSLLRANGEYISEGDTIPPRPQLENTLKAIRDTGFHEFYTGTVANHLITDINNACAMNTTVCRGLSSIITTEDLENYQVQNRTPFVFQYDSNSGYDVYTAPAPYGGSALAVFLGIVTGKVTSVSADDDVYHYLTEAAKFASSHRMKLGDPDSGVGNSRANVSPQMAEEEIGTIIEKLTNNGAKAQPESDLDYYGFEVGEADNDLGTTHFSVITPEMAVSVTSSINDYFGSGFLSSTTGVLLNNDMDAFSIGTEEEERFPYNRIGPGRRPLSSMCPTVVVDRNGDFKLVTGAAGGTRIPPAVGQTMINALTKSKSIKDSTCMPRVYAELPTGSVTITQDVEKSMGETAAVPAFPSEILQALQNDKMHCQPTYDSVDQAKSNVQSILNVSGELHAHSDVRKYGGMCNSISCGTSCNDATQCLICNTASPSVEPSSGGTSSSGGGTSSGGGSGSNSPNWAFHHNVKLLLIFISFILQYVCISI